MAAAVTMWLLPFLCSHWTLHRVSSALCCRPPTWVCYLLCLKCHVNALCVSTHLPLVAMATYIFVWIMVIKRDCVCRMKWKASISQIGLTSRASLLLDERVFPNLVENFPPHFMATEGEIVEFTTRRASCASAWNEITRKASTITLRMKFRKLWRGGYRRYDENKTR